MSTNQVLVMMSVSVLGLGACVRTRNYTPLGVGNPSSSKSEVATYTPPKNLFAIAINPSDSAEGADSTAGMKGMDGMDGMADTKDAGGESSGLKVYTCTMHADVRSDRPGNCPKGGMKLMPMKASPIGEHQHGGLP